jgi:hypothetical protein
VLFAQLVLDLRRDRFRCGSEVPEQITKKVREAGDIAQVDRDDVLGLFVRGESRAQRR